MPITRFAGYRSPNYTMVPDELIDEQLPFLSGAELKALLYIIRRTLGFKKQSDNISLSQLLTGITTRAGESLDHGTGLSRSSLVTALKGLVAKNLIIMEQRSSREQGNLATNYRLNLLYDPRSKIEPGESENRTRGVQKLDQQETSRQEIDLQLRNSKTMTSDDDLPDRAKDIPLSREVDPNATYPLNPHRSGSSSGRSNGLDRIDAVLERLRQSTSSTERSLAESTGGHPSIAHATEQLAVSITEISQELGDIKHLRSNFTQASRLLQLSGLPETAFVSKLYEARAITKDRQRSTSSASPALPVMRPMAYFWRIVRDQLGLPASTANAAIVPDAPGLNIRQGRREELLNGQSEGG